MNEMSTKIQKLNLFSKIAKHFRVCCGLVMLLLMSSLSWQAVAQIVIGEQTNTSSSLPINGVYDYSYSQQIVYQNEINANGNITSLSVNFATGTNTVPSDNWTILLGHTDKTGFTSTSDWIAAAELTQVFNGAVTFPVPGNLMTVTFDNSFNYNGTDNLVIAVRENKPAYASLSFGRTADITGSNRSMYTSRDNTPIDLSLLPVGKSRYNHINNMTLGGIQQSCPAPNELTATDITQTEATLGWAETGSATQWEVIYGPVGFDLETSGTTITDATSPTLIEGLVTNTAYSFYVKAICAADDESSFTGPYNFITACGNATVPYLLDFETATTPNLPNCTSRENNGIGNNWTTKTAPTGFTGKVLNYSYHASSNPGPANSWFYTQALELEAGVNYELSYKFGNNSTSYTESMKVALGTAPTEASMTTQLADYPSIQSPSSAPNFALITFAVPTDGVYYFGFNVYSIENQNQLYVDDIGVDVAPNCPAPTDLASSNLTAETAVLSWVESASATQWHVLYGEAGFDPLTAGTLVSVDNNLELAISDLTSNTAYDFYVTAICGLDDESEMVGPESFSTPCVAGMVPFFDGFESGNTNATALGGCWSQQSLLNAEVWMVNSSETTNQRTPRTGAFNINLKWNNDDWIFYALDLTGGTPYQLKFYSRQNSSSGASVQAAFGDANNAAAMTTSIIGSSPVIGGEYQEFAGFFTPDASGVYYIGIKATLNFGPNYLSLDDVSVEEALGCLEPSGLMASNISSESADLSWTPITSETEWTVLYGETGFNPESEGIELTATNDPEISLSNLTSNTTYDVYITAICGVGDESDLVGPISFTTACTATDVPFTQNFEEVIVPAIPNCGSLEVNYGNPWKTGTQTSYGFNSKVLVYGYHSTPNAADSWYFTQGINLEAGVDYQISYQYGNNYTTYTEKLKVAYGSSASSIAMTEELADHTISLAGSEFNTVPFSVATPGVYYFGFQAHSTTNQFDMYLDNIEVIPAVVWECPDFEANIGDACDDGDEMTGDDVYNESCECVGTPIIVFDCPAIEANFGDACDDGDVETENDLITEACECVGTPIAVDDNCGSENFDNAELTTSYGDGSFVGNDGVTWTYVASRDQNEDANASGIDGNAIMLRRVADDSKIISSAVAGGIADFSAKLYKGFTGAGDRQVELFVNGVSQGLSEPFDDFDEHIFTVSGINISEDVIIEIRNSTSRQVIVDDITWTCASDVVVFDCPAIEANFGDACDDGDATTENDVITEACECVGTPIVEPIAYCVPEATNSARYVNNFITTGGSANIDNSGSGFSTGGYGDFTTMTVIQVQANTVSFTADILGGSAGFRIWVDWNQDGVFDTANEVAYQSTGYSVAHSGSFAVPDNATPGPTRMRVVSHWLSTVGLVDPCATGFTYGEFEDYTFNVVPLEDCTEAIAGTIVGSTEMEVCANAPFSLSVEGNSDPATGLIRTWQSSPVGEGVWTDLDVSTSTLYVVGVDTPMDYRYHVECANGDSDNSGVISISLNPNPQECYCVVQTNSTYYMNSFTTTGGIVNITNSLTSAPVGGYGNFTSQMVSQEKTGVVSFTGTMSSSTHGMKIWVDWNQDGVFGANEIAYQSTGYSGTITGTITVPENALDGVTRMRVGTHSGNSGGPASACENSPTGIAYQDYSFEAIPLDACIEAIAGNIIGDLEMEVCATAPFVLTVEGSSEPADGLLRTWQSSPVGEGVWTDLNISSSTFNVTGVTEPTDYRYHVECENGDSDDTEVISVSINPNPQECYCIPGGTNVNYYINDFSTTGGVVNIENLGSGHSPNGYGDFTATHTVSQVKTGVVNFAADYGSGSNTFGTKIWVDWNQNGSFETSEIVYQSTTYAGFAENSFTVPESALLGTTRMRIGISYTPGSGPNDPCEVGSREFEDYAFEVLALDACADAVAGTITSPDMSVCAGVAFTLEVEGSSDAADGLTRQWMSSTDGVNWVAIEGALGTSYTASTGVMEETQFKYVVSCTNDNSTDETEAVTVSLNPANECYCDATSSSSEPITRVVFAGIDNTSPAATSSPGYEDFTDVVAAVAVGGTYSFTAEGNTDGAYEAFFTVWIDWNHNGVFGTDEMYEIPGSINGSTGSDGQQVTGNITVPEGAILGETRMRVRKRYNESSTNPCGSYSFGQTEDYTVNLTEAGDWDCPDLNANIGDPCDDGDASTENDTVTADCECVGTPVVDLGCINSSRYPFNTESLATPELVTINTSIYFGDYSEVTGIISGYEYEFSGVANSDGSLGYITLRSGTVDGPIIAEGFSSLTITATSNDNIFIHWNVDADCGTSFDFITGTGLCITCATVVDCEGVTGGTALPGTSCDDGDDTTVNDVYDADCNCAGEPAAVGSICSSAIAIECNEDAVTHSSAASNGSNTTACSMGNNGLWFSFMGNGGAITVNSTATFDHRLSVNSGSCDALTSIVCQDISTGAENYTIDATIDGEMYYVYIASYSSGSTTTGDITISIECETTPVCLSPEMTLTAQDADGTIIDDCIEDGSDYYVLATLSGGEGNDTYNVSANGGDAVTLEPYGSTVFGPFTAGSDVTVVAVGAQDDDCGVAESIDSPGICPPPVYDCPAIEANYGDACTNDAGEEGVIDENCECYVAPPVFDCPEIEANYGDVCTNDAGEEGVINESCECYVAPVFDCPEIEANYGDVCTNDAGEEGVVDENCECFVTPVFDCPEIEANYGDVCTNDAGEEGVIDESCECYVAPVYDCPEIEADYGDNCIIEGTEDVGLINNDCECVPVSATTVAGFNFNMYPNPAGSNESVTLTSNQSIDRYEILDITGKLIDAQIILNQNEIVIALRNYSAGMYILKAYSGSEFSTQKMVVR